MWIVPVLVAAAQAAWRYRSRAARAARAPWAGLACLVLLFLSYPAVGRPPNPAQVKGLIWSVPVGGNREYGWRGWELAVGNLYVLAGLAMLCGAAVAALRAGAARRAGREPLVPAVPVTRERA